jgi:hypothetical protein
MTDGDAAHSTDFRKSAETLVTPAECSSYNGGMPDPLLFSISIVRQDALHPYEYDDQTVRSASPAMTREPSPKASSMRFVS